MKHVFSGAYSPGKFINTKIFSVGCYGLIPKKNGKGMKKTEVKVRVSGLCMDAGSVYEKAREICKKLDSGEYDGPKNVRVKGGE